MIGSYTIEFPISQELPYQQLYRGRQVDQSVQLLHIFPTASLSESMYSQIIQRSNQYPHIQELIEDDLAILIAYKDSHLWSMIDSKLDSPTLHKILPNLYYQYLELGEGYVDFDPEFVFHLNDTIYLMDYGLKESDVPKTQLFALQILSWIKGKPVQLKQIDEMNREIVHFCGKYKISPEIIDLLLIMIANTIPFDSLQDLKFFQQHRHMQTVASTIDVPKIKQNTFMQLLSQRKQSDSHFNKTAQRPQSQDLMHISQNLHLSKVKAAVNRNSQQYTSQNKKLGSTCSQFRIAQSQITKNLRGFKGKSTSNGFGMTSTEYTFAQTKTQQQFFQPASQTLKQFYVEPPKQEEYPKKQVSIEAKVEPKQQFKQVFTLEPPKIPVLLEADTKTKIPQLKSPPQQFVNEKYTSSRLDTQELESLDIGKQQKPSKQLEFKKPSSTTEIKQQPEIKIILDQQDQQNNNNNNKNNNNITNNNVSTIKTVEKVPEIKRQITEPVPIQKQLKTNESDNLLEEPKISKPTTTVNTKILQNQIIEQVHQDYFDKYNNYLSIINIIGITTVDINIKLAASTAIWIMPLSVIFKRLYQIRMKVQEDLELKKNMFKLSKFKEFLNTQHYTQLLTHIKEQNEITKSEFNSMLTIAEKMAPKLDEAGRQKILTLLKADLDKDLRDHAYAYLYSQIYARVKKIINSVKANQMPKNKYTLLEWLLLRFQILECSLIILMPIYEINEEYHDTLLYSEIMKSTDEQEIEQECEILENKLKNFR